MIALLETHKDDLAQLCQKYGVLRLEVFGSAARSEDFSEQSDIDFLVEFAPETDLGPWLKHYFELKDELEALLQRPVDLVEVGAVRNPFVRQSMERWRETIYAAA